MSESLATYIHDHLAGSTFAIDLVRTMGEKRKGEPLGQFAEVLLSEIEKDSATLRDLAERVGAGPSPLKEMSAWFSQKISRFKLTSHPGDPFGTFEALEFLALGIHGKRALWQALAVIAATDGRLKGFDFAKLTMRAETQEAQVENWRLKIARTGLQPAA